MDFVNYDVGNLENGSFLFELEHREMLLHSESDLVGGSHFSINEKLITDVHVSNSD